MKAIPWKFQEDSSLGRTWNVGTWHVKQKLTNYLLKYCGTEAWPLKRHWPQLRYFGHLIFMRPGKVSGALSAVPNCEGTQEKANRNTLKILKTVFLSAKDSGKLKHFLFKKKKNPIHTPSLHYSLLYSFNAAAAAKSLQSCPTLCNSIDGSPPGSPVPGILQARTLEWVAISFSNAWKWRVRVKLLSRVRLFATPWTAAYQAPPPLGFSRQEYWSGVPLPSPIFI